VVLLVGSFAHRSVRLMYRLYKGKELLLAIHYERRGKNSRLTVASKPSRTATTDPKS
jgi:hypothetical protein